MSRDPSIGGVDHVELYVSDWDEAAAWYERVLGLAPDDSYAEWRETRSGPLMLSVDGTTDLALFERESAKRGEGVSPYRVAFGTDADGFLAFLDRLVSLDLTDHAGDTVTRRDVVDHELTYSVYFTDPDGNLLELTTDEYDAVTDGLS